MDKATTLISTIHPIGLLDHPYSAPPRITAPAPREPLTITIANALEEALAISQETENIIRDIYDPSKSHDSDGNKERNNHDLPKQ
jgi:hypothetical protein